MSRDDWFRNEDWTSTIEQNFYVKLKRARRKAQYLCIQAHHLSRSHPEIALRLLNEYFALDDRFNHARAFSFQADAYLALGNIDLAIEAYEHGLAREKEFPNFRTQSWIELPYLIATRQIHAKYQRALELLNAPDTILFPVQKFKIYAAHALILAALGDHNIASDHAKEALREAGQRHSGLRYHSELGLVGSQYEVIAARLQQIIDNREKHSP